MASLKRGQAEAIHDEVRTVVARWREYADAVRVTDALRENVQSNLRLELQK